MILLWISFVVIILIMLSLDLGVFHRKAHEISIKEALVWTSIWVGLSLIFSIFVFFLYQYRLFGAIGQDQPSGYEATILFLTGYVVEKSLSIDNIFVMAMIFAFFGVPSAFQHRVLFWGILGAMVLRAAMIFGGIALIHRFSWMLYVFGAFLIYSAYRMLYSMSEVDPSKNSVVRLSRRIFPVSDDYDGSCFITHCSNRWMLTPMALVLVAIESSDIIFAVDSIPAIFAITDIPFIIFTSNIFAILGLRSMYFALSAVLKKFRHLKSSLSVLLALVGIKMILKDYLEELPGKTYILLGAIIFIMGSGILASVFWPGTANKKPV